MTGRKHAMTKYRAIKTNGYASKREAKRAAELKLLAKAGKIQELREQVVFVLAPSVVIGGRKRPQMKYIADFCYIENGKAVIEDVKGVLTAVYKLKRHLMAAQGYEILET